MSSILVIDSGVGGLSICRSILSRLPDIQITYFADKAQFPYGLKSESELLARLHVVVDHMLEKHTPSLVVLACNTVSTLVLPELRAKHDLPFVGVVPAIKPAALISDSKHIGLLATPATVERPYIDELITAFASDCDVLRVGSSELVSVIEDSVAGHKIAPETLVSLLKPFQNDDGQFMVDTLVLGCTHFPVLKPQFEALYPEINWIDSGEAIARRVQELLAQAECSEDNEQNSASSQGRHTLYFSADLPERNRIDAFLRSQGIVNYDILAANI